LSEIDAMDHEVIRGGDQEEAIGAHSGFRIRVVTAWDAAARQFRASAYVRGSETEEEVAIAVPGKDGKGFALLQDAQDFGFAAAVRWIDSQGA
jgi:hypothetical protein